MSNTAVEQAAEQAAAEQIERVRSFAQTHQSLRGELGKRIVGQAQILEDLLTAILAQGHALLIGVPGLAKTLMVQTLSDILHLSFPRIQFTPDLMPADITGTEVLEEDRTTGHRVFRFVRGPVFANLVLADEINRTPPKTQAALLQAMQERARVGGPATHPLPQAVLRAGHAKPHRAGRHLPAARGPVGPLHVRLEGRLSPEQEELAIALSTTGGRAASWPNCWTPNKFWICRRTVRQVPVSEHVAQYAVRLARATRPAAAQAPDFIKQYVSWGAGPRAVQYLVLGAKARAVLAGTMNVSCDHVRDVAPLVLRHRVLTNFAAEADGIDSDELVARLLKQIPEAC